MRVNSSESDTSFNGKESPATKYFCTRLTISKRQFSNSYTKLAVASPIIIFSNFTIQVCTGTDFVP